MSQHRPKTDDAGGVLSTRLSRRDYLRTGVTGAAGLGAAFLTGRSAAPRVAAQGNGCPGDATLDYGFWGLAQQPAIEQQIDLFREEHENISVNPQVTPFSDYWTRLQTGVAGGEIWDVFWMNAPNAAIYANQGALLDLQSLVDSGAVDLSLYPEPLLDMYTHDGKIYGIPRDFDTIALFYNKELFDAAGVPYPTDEWTWDDLRAAAEELTVRDGDTTTQWGFASSPLTDQQNYFNFILQNGGRIVNEDFTQVVIDEPASCEAIAFLTGFVQDGLSPNSAEVQANDPYQTLFPAGQIAMIPGGSWNAAPFHEANPAIDVAPLPMREQRASMIHGLSNTIWIGSPHQCEALEFVKFLAGREAEQVLADTGTVIPAMNGLQEAWVASIPEMNLQVFIDAVSYAVPIPDSPIGPEWRSKIQEVLIDAWSGGDVSPEDVCSSAAEAATAVLSDG